MSGKLTTEQRDAIRESNRRRAHTCARCGSSSLYRLTDEQVARRDDTLPGLHYKACNACGHTWTVKGGAR